MPENLWFSGLPKFKQFVIAKGLTPNILDSGSLTNNNHCSLIRIKINIAELQSTVRVHLYWFPVRITAALEPGGITILIPLGNHTAHKPIPYWQ